MSVSSQQFCLFLEGETQTDLPVRLSEKGLRYLQLDCMESFSSRDGRLCRPAAGEPQVRMETVCHKSQPSLVVTFTPELRMQVNGLSATRFAVLKSGDVIAFDDHVLHVSLLNRPYIGPPNESHLAANCGYCRMSIADSANMRIYSCPRCQQPTHFQGEEVELEDRLECARLTSHCGHCQAEIAESEGFSYVPEF